MTFFRSRQSFEATSATSGKAERTEPSENVAQRRLTRKLETFVERHLTQSQP